MFDELNFKIKLFGENCQLDPTSELHDRIIDVLSWKLIKLIEYNARLPIELEYSSLNFNKLFEAELASALTTTVTIIKVQVSKNYLSLETEFYFLLELDQRFIDEYVGSATKSLITEAFNQ